MCKTFLRKVRALAGARRVLSGRGRCCRALAGVAVVVALTGAGLIVPGYSAGAAASTAAGARHPASPECSSPRHANTSIVGTIHNDTNVALNLVRAEHGITNKWCIRPAEHIPAHGSVRYDATDRIFDTVVSIVYRFHSLDTSVQFAAGKRPAGFGFHVGCEVKGKERSHYRCEGILTKLVDLRHATVIFKVLPASSATRTARTMSRKGPAARTTTTVSWKGPELKPFHSVYLPRLRCPSDYPYLLDKIFNPGSGFRLTRGAEFTGYRSGFDVVALSTDRIPFERNGVKGHMNVGLSGVRDFIFNSATNLNWFTPTGFTLVLHCTSDPSKGAFDRPKDS